MESKPRLILLDFCETLISFQTADRFVRYCVCQLDDRGVVCRSRIVGGLDKLKVFKILNKFTVGSKKRALLWQLKGVAREQLEQLARHYFEEELQPNVIAKMVEVMKQHQTQGDTLYILSGGYDLYIRYFAEYYGLDGYVACHIGFTDAGKCSGRMVGKDCMREEKVCRWKEIKGQYAETICYSDSKSDLPILLAVDKGVVVSHNHAQEWAKEYQLDEIIWN